MAAAVSQRVINASVPAGDLETGNAPQVDYHHRPLANATSITPDDVVKLRCRLSAYFSKANIMNWLLPAMFICKMLYHRHIHSMKSVSFVAFGIVSLVSFFLNCFGLFSSGREASHVQLLCKIAYASTMLRMLAAVTLLLFYEVLKYAMIPLMVFLALLLQLHKKTFDAAPTRQEEAHIIGAKHYWAEAHETQLDFLFDLSAEVVSMCFSGLCGSVFGYVKNSLDQSHLTRGHKSPEGFLFYGTTIGLLVKLLTTVPPAAYLGEIRRRVVEVYLRFLAYAAVLFLLMACLAAAEAILHEYICFAFLPDVIVVVLCFWTNHSVVQPRRRDNDDHKAELKSCLYPASIYAVMFGFLINWYVGSAIPVPCCSSSHPCDPSQFLRDSSHSLPFKVLVFAVLSSIVTYFTRIVVILETPCLDSMAIPKQVWAWATYLLMAVTAIFSVLVLARHPDELWSIT